ncbi:MAG: HEAT repeat domain-containing protein [Planctomycetes bacterium]|nr:HEAT repeat domain-containing protein [Planctomycetota bacterium]
MKKLNEVLLVTFTTACLMLTACDSKQGESRAPDKGQTGKAPDKVEPIPYSDSFLIDNPPITRAVEGNPLKYAAQRIDLDLDSFELPRPYEGLYRLACRFPIIDAVANRPLYMKQWAEDTTEQINKFHKEKGLGAIPFAISVLRETDQFPMKDYGPDEKAMKALKEDLSKSNFTPKYQEILLNLYGGYSIAQQMVKAAKGNLSEDDLKFFYANPGYFLAPDGKRMPSVTGNVDTHFMFIERARKVGYEYIFAAAMILADASSGYVNATKGFKQADYFTDPDKANETFNCGDMVITGFGDDEHKNTASFLIDLGGNDTYTNNAGGSFGTKGDVAVCLDHSGDDYYKAPDKSYVQGFGFLGVGYLIDLAGNDKYYAKHFSQGVGIIGVGAIYDVTGDDIYDAHAVCQGAGIIGVGMILDTSGNDLYDCATNGQGSATTLGLGVLSDLEGNDKYQLALDKNKDNLGVGPLPGYGQGGALSFRPWPPTKKFTPYGGIGILTDGAGNDTYQTAGWCDQGGSYIMSLGALVDYAGNDNYTNGRGGGSSIHITNAIIIDKDGDDVYNTNFLGFGSGSDRSPGIFIDYRGNDTYNKDKDCVMSYGAGCKPLGFSLFIDYEGVDTYHCKYPALPTDHPGESFGGISPESDCRAWPYSIFLDLGGKDNYQIPLRENDTERFSYGHGIHLDTTWPDGDVIGKITNPLPPYGDYKLPQTVNNEYIKLLQNPDLFSRFQAIGQISNAGPEIIPQLVESIVNSTHRQFNRDIMECIHYYLTRDKISGKESAQLVPLLKAADAEVRIIIAHDLGLWGFKNAIPALLETLEKDSEGQVRRFALAGLLLLDAREALPLVRKLLATDSTADVRRVAIGYLDKLDRENSIDLILKAMETDSSPIVRGTAAEVFVNYRDERAKGVLERAVKSDDVYLRRAAAKGLANFGNFAALEILIDSMDFRSIDTSGNYGENVPAYIARYTGVNTPGDGSPYDPAAWKKWLKENKDKIDIRKNADAYLDFALVTENSANLSDEEKIRQYEEFLAKFPGYIPAREVLGNLLNGVAWNMVTADKSTPAFNAELGLKYAIRAVELNPIPMIIDTLAEAYEANGQIDDAIEICEEQLKKTPEEAMFKERFERYRKMKE